jgi:hypothetical protein
VVNNNNEPVFINKKLLISFEGKFKTPEVRLPAGNYRITQLWIVNENNQARFASPVINSAKAIKVNKPLPVSFILPPPAVLQVPVEVAKIEAGDTPEVFGYPAGTFSPGSGNPNDQTAFILIKLKLAIRVGEINYDNIPATVTYSSWDENQQPLSSYIVLAAGENQLSISRKAVKHHFRITKWGQLYELTLLKNEIRDGATYVIGGSKQAKKLKAELTYKLVGGVYKPESKTSFNYGGDGKLSTIDYYLKKADNTTYLAMHDVFQYNNTRVEKINRFNENNQASGYTAFSYNGSGKVSGIIESANNIVTTAAVTYHSVPETGLSEVAFDYSYSHTSNSMRYYQRYSQGNKIADNSNTVNNNTETGQYDFDSSINPYTHMGWPDLFLSNSSRNNITWQQKTYYGSYPAAVAYEFIYKYDGEGYPIELIRHYRSYLTNQFLYTTKTIFNY